MPQTHFGLLIKVPVQLIERVVYMYGHEQTIFTWNQIEYDARKLLLGDKVMSGASQSQRELKATINGVCWQNNQNTTPSKRLLERTCETSKTSKIVKLVDLAEQET